MIRRPPRSTLSSSSAASDVYKRQLERRDVELALLLVVLRSPAVGQQAGVHPWVQRLDPAIQALRESGEFGDRRNGDAGILQKGGGGAGRDDLDARGRQPQAHFGQTALVVHAHQRAPNRLLGHRHTTFRLPEPTVRSQPARAIRPTTSTYRSRSTA